jgi:hypothetical protein
MFLFMTTSDYFITALWGLVVVMAGMAIKQALRYYSKKNN